jgi:hypothetical protein
LVGESLGKVVGVFLVLVGKSCGLRNLVGIFWYSFEFGNFGWCFVVVYEVCVWVVEWGVCFEWELCLVGLSRVDRLW